MRHLIFEHGRASGDTLREYVDGAVHYFEYEYACGGACRLEVLGARCAAEPARLYLGHSLDEVLASGRDLLGEELTRDGDPDYGAVRGVLPEITEDAYCFLGGAASHGSLTVDRLGVVRLQPYGKQAEGDILFSPSELCPQLADAVPRQAMLDGRLPILVSTYGVGGEATELVYFVEYGDTDAEPTLWIRVREGEHVRLAVASVAHELGGGRVAEVERCLFYDCFADTVACWLKFLSGGASYSLPVAELGRVAEGTMTSLATTFTGPRPHYGHKFYGKALHDNFPPNYIFAIEAACVSGQVGFAREIFGHLIGYGLNSAGRFVYRQGPMLLGSSAAEYGMLLWLVARYRRLLMPDGLTEEARAKLSGMGEVILASCVSCAELDGLTLVRMCAEADNNVRVNVYLNNNLWAVRGLSALAELVGKDIGEKYAEMAEILRQNIQLMIEKHGERGTEYGDVPPFRFGYPTVPLTLSNCGESSAPMSDAERERYFRTVSGRRDFDVSEQEITENTYANYRYYPEALSAMLLPENYAEGIYGMRARLGGNLLGMTRFRSWLDDWPVLNYARYLLECGRVSEYLLLLYSHVQHHGHPELLCYYEQAKLWGQVSAPDCVPSLLTAPIMTAWAFAYERVGDGTLRLLSGLPAAWYSEPFRAVGIGCSHGRLSVRSDGESISFKTDFPLPAGTELVWRARESLSIGDVAVGRETVERVNGNVIYLAAGLTEFTVKIAK